MLRHLTLLLIITLGLALPSSYGQSEDEQEIAELIKTREELINLAKSTPRISELVNLHTSDFVSVNTVYLPDGSFTRKERDLDGWKTVLSHYADAGDLQYEVSFENLAFAQVYERTAVAIYRISYEMKDVWDKSVLYGGDQIITANFRKTPDGWKYRDIYVTELRSTINKYPCTYELYQKDANEMLVNVKVPAGSEFRNEYIDVRFKELKPGLNIIHTDKGDEFSWENNVLRASASSESAEIIGRPNSKTAVCDDLIMYYHSTHCADARMNK